MYTKIQALEVRGQPPGMRGCRGASERECMVLRVHKVPHPGCAAEEGITTHPPTSRPGLQSVLLQFNQRSYRRVVEYVRGVKERAHAASPTRSDAQAERGERPDKPCKRGRTEQTGQTFPKDPVPLSSATMLELSSSHVPQAVSRRKAPSARGVPQATGFPWRHTRIDITTILHNAPQLHYSLHLTHTIRSSPSRGPRNDAAAPYILVPGQSSKGHLIQRVPQ
jgi:hypothetical protein